jgi:hypothetical protein
MAKNRAALTTSCQQLQKALIVVPLAATLNSFAPLAVSSENTAKAESTKADPNKIDTTRQEIIAATHLASHREIVNLRGIKKMAIGVSPLPQALTETTEKQISATSLCNILSERAQACKVEVDPKIATHLLLLTLSPVAKHDYQLVLTVRPIKKTTTRPLYSLKMRATMSGHYPKRINELVERASIIFWRNYQLAN